MRPARGGRRRSPAPPRAPVRPTPVLNPFRGFTGRQSELESPVTPERTAPHRPIPPPGLPAVSTTPPAHGRVGPMSEADPGLFGPDSVTWQMHGDPMMWVAGVRALYLQALHPRAVRGVMQNSDFRKDAWGRLLRTANFVGTITLRHHRGRREGRGPRPAGSTACCRPPTPPPASATASTNPSCCCGCTAPRSTPTCTSLRRSGFPLTDAQADRYVDEHRVSARLVGLDPDDGTRPTGPSWPPTSRRYGPNSPPDAEARDVDDFLRRPPAHPLLVPARELLWRRVAHLAYAALPPYAHELYGSPRPRTGRASPAGCAPRAPLLRCVPARLRWQLPPRSHPEGHGTTRPRRPPRTVQTRADRPPYWTGQGRAQRKRRGRQQAMADTRLIQGRYRLLDLIGRGRHGRGVAGPRRVAGPAGRGQVPQAAGPAARPGLHPGPAGALPPRGPGRRRPPAPRGDRRPRLRRGRRRALPRHGAAGGPQPQPAAGGQQAAPAARARCRRHRRAGRRRPRLHPSNRASSTAT